MATFNYFGFGDSVSGATGYVSWERDYGVKTGVLRFCFPLFSGSREEAQREARRIADRHGVRLTV